MYNKRGELQKNCGAVNRNAALRNTSTCASRLGSMGLEYPPPMVITRGTSRAMHIEYTALFRRSNPSRLIASRPNESSFKASIPAWKNTIAGS